MIRREEDVMTQTPTSAPPAQLRDRAVEQLKKKRAFYGHLLVYVLVNATIVVVWAMTSSRLLLADLPDARVGDRCDHERLGRLARRLHRRPDRPRDGAAPAASLNLRTASSCSSPASRSWRSTSPPRSASTRTNRVKSSPPATGQEPPRRPLRTHRGDLHGDRAEHRAAEHAVHHGAGADLLPVVEVAVLEPERPQAVVGDEDGEHQARAPEARCAVPSHDGALIGSLP